MGMAVIGFALAVRLVRLEPVEIGGDALNKWYFVRQWFYDFDITQVRWTHHYARMGVNLPLVLVQAILGRHAVVYYVVAVGVATATAVLVYAIGRLSHGRAVGVLASLWFVLFPSWERAGSQITPESFGALYVGACLLCLLMYERAKRHKLGWLVAAGGGISAAYLAKGTMVFFLPGVLLATFVLGKRRAHVAIVALVPLVTLGVETLFYRLVSSYSSRLSIISSTHHTGKSAAIEGVWDFFARYGALPSYWRPLLLMALAGALGLPFLTRNKRVLALICVPASFFFFYTFAVRRLDPPRFWTRFLERYLDAAVPFAALVALCFVAVVSARVLGSRWVRARVELSPLLLRGTRWAPAFTVALLLGVGGYVYLHKPPNARHPLVGTPKLERLLTDAYRRGIPIIGKGRSPLKPLRAAYKIYIEDQALLKNGRLSTINVRKGRRLVRPDAPRLPRRCRVVVFRKGRWLGLRPMKKLGAGCG